jgi:hypothetical protein
MIFEYKSVMYLAQNSAWTIKRDDVIILLPDGKHLKVKKWGVTGTGLPLPEQIEEIDFNKPKYKNKLVTLAFP